MAEPDILRALVLQGGGALGAFELGVARVLFGEQDYRPDMIAGVSIGAITAALLARPRGGDPLKALEAFWGKVTLDGEWLFPSFRPYASVFGNPAFYVPRSDWWRIPWWTNFYDTGPLLETLTALIDLDALADPNAMPRLLVTATDVKAGEIKPFYSGAGGLTLKHLLASGSLPPGFPMTEIDQRPYWDGGLFDNTPLGEVLDQMDEAQDRKAEREVVVVNLFPNKGPEPGNMREVSQRTLNLMFANRTASDIGLLERFNAVAELLDRIRDDPEWAALKATPEFKAADEKYLVVPNILPITRTSQAKTNEGSDFSPAGIENRAKEGVEAAWTAIAEHIASSQPGKARWKPRT